MSKRGVFVKGVIVGIVVVCLFSFVNSLSNRITREGRVKELKYWGIIAEDSTGRKWAYHTDEDFQVFDKVRITFDCNNTLDNYTDNKLLKVSLDK